MDASSGQGSAVGRVSAFWHLGALVPIFLATRKASTCISRRGPALRWCNVYVWENLKYRFHDRFVPDTAVVRDCRRGVPSTS